MSIFYLLYDLYTLYTYLTLAVKLALTYAHKLEIVMRLHGAPS